MDTILWRFQSGELVFACACVYLNIFLCFLNAHHRFAERSDLILLLFDAHKLDISDEFKRTIESLKGHDDKIRCILNKADQIDRQKLMRVYGALMWSMGKVLKTPEVLRVFIGSFWDQVVGICVLLLLLGKGVCCACILRSCH